MARRSAQAMEADRKDAEILPTSNPLLWVEDTMSVGVQVAGMRRSGYCGLAKTRLQHLCTASALNLLRVADHLSGRPRAQTRVSAFERLLAQVA